MSSDEPLDCRAAARLISAALEDDVGPVDRRRLQHHFVVCRTCRTVDEQMNFLRAAMNRLGELDANREPDPGR